MVSCCFALSEHPHFVSVRRGAVRCPVWGFICVVSCVNSFSKLCGWNWRIKIPWPSWFFCGSGWNSSCLKCFALLWWSSANDMLKWTYSLTAMLFIHAEAHGLTGKSLIIHTCFHGGCVCFFFLSEMLVFFLLLFLSEMLVWHVNRRRSKIILFSSERNYQ